MRPQIAIYDPFAFGGQNALRLNPLIQRHCCKALAPEVLIQLDDRQSSELTQSCCRGRLSCPTTPQDDHSLHLDRHLTVRTLRLHRRRLGEPLPAYIACPDSVT
ncbi:MAG: hypothetical protein JWO59_1964 [Chloroflexi bacterium]|nr:hypothetical protein [Chloroflexota bacterium]